VSALPVELRDLIESGPMAHLSTINADGSPQVTVIWVGLDGDDLVSGHMSRYVKLRNIEPGEAAWDLLNRLAKVYVAPDAEFPGPRGPGYLVRYSVERIGGVGPWRPASH